MAEAIADLLKAEVVIAAATEIKKNRFASKHLHFKFVFAIVIIIDLAVVNLALLLLLADCFTAVTIELSVVTALCSKYLLVVSQFGF